jgi:YfiH family protein
MYKSGSFLNSKGESVADWAFTDRSGGNSLAPFDSLNLATHVGDSPLAVAFNREKVLSEFGHKDVTWLGPVHGTDVGFVEKSAGLFPDVDALITKRRGNVLATMGADCVPLLACDTENKIVLSAHIGWKGAANSIHENLLDAIKELGGNPASTQVLLGPAICGSCYKVDESRIAAVARVLPAAAVDGGVDLRFGLKNVLANKVKSVEVVGDCTFELPTLFSHRRDGVTGRQAGFVVLL